MNKEEFIAKYGEEAYKRRLQKAQQSRLRKLKEYGINHYYKEYISDPIHKLIEINRSKKYNIAHYRKNIDNYIVSPDEAMILLKEKAEEAGCPELLNMDYMIERFHINCKYGLAYGNLEILTYFYRLMQIKAAKNESFTESDKEMIHYFRNWEGVDNPGTLFFNNNWIIDVANIDMAYVEDMIRNTRGLDLLLTEEKYNELKGLTVKE